MSVGSPDSFRQGIIIVYQFLQRPLHAHSVPHMHVAAVGLIIPLLAVYADPMTSVPGVCGSSSSPPCSVAMAIHKADRYIAEYRDGWVDGWMDGRMNRYIER